MSTTAQRLQAFVNYVAEYLKGDEKGEAPIFLDKFFRAFGHAGAIEAGATYEERIHKGSKKGKTGFADLVWKPRVLIEMKKRGADLSKHYSQAVEYWWRLTPKTKYVILCNFDEFWIYDFNIQVDTPIDRVPLAQLPERAATFGFMEVQERKSVFGNNQVVVTEKAAKRLGELYQTLRDRIMHVRHIDKPEAALVAQRFVLQCVLAMFAEDRNLLPNSLFVACVQDCLTTGASSYDVLGNLFREMNTPGTTPAGRFQGVAYFNGGLFRQIDPIDLTQQELKLLEISALEDWSKVRPAIFGSIFESAIDTKERHAHGIHYTSEADIMKIVRPTISRYWEDRIEKANTIKELEALQLELQAYRVLDPACGSGNFLYIAYQEIKQIEQDLLDKIAERRRSPRDQIQMGFVTPLQFFGIDNNPFAVELARVTLMIARKVAVDRLGLTEATLPLDTLDDNIRCQDALFTEWPKADAIIGNPPFLGGHWLRTNLGNEYAEKIFERFSEVEDQVDFCTYWFRLAHDNLQNRDDSEKRTILGRASLVGTNTLSQGKARTAGIEYILKNGGFIHEAISSQPWSGEAAVHVCIVNWIYEDPQKRFLDNTYVEQINASLKNQSETYSAQSLRSNKDFCLQGVMPGGMGFFIDHEKVNDWIKIDAKNQFVLKPFLDGSSLAKNVNGKPSRWIIDFDDSSLEEASEYTLPFGHIKKTVKPERDKNRRESRRVNWWKYGENAPKLRRRLAKLKAVFFVVPEVSKWAVFLPSDPKWIAGKKVKSIVSSDFYIFGILTSNVHRTWMHAQKSTLKADIAYTHNTCFETFPFPQNPSPAIVQKIRDKALELHQYRSQQMEQKQWGITKLYNAYFDEPASQLYKLHKQLDALVLQAYGWSDKGLKSLAPNDLLEKLLTLNLALAEKEQNNEPVIGPWDPTK